MLLNCRLSVSNNSKLSNILLHVNVAGLYLLRNMKDLLDLFLQGGHPDFLSGYVT